MKLATLLAPDLLPGWWDVPEILREISRKADVELVAMKAARRDERWVDFWRHADAAHRLHLEHCWWVGWHRQGTEMARSSGTRASNQPEEDGGDE